MTLPVVRVAILTVSDRASRGEREDVSGAVARDLIVKLPAEVVRTDVLPDERSLIARRLHDLADSGGVDLILTTGGTGFAPRDVTPEATRDVIDREVPGIPEALRRGTGVGDPRTILSRAVAGLRGKTLIINLPGSPKGVRECLTMLLPVLPHALDKTRGEGMDCGHES